MKKIYTPILTLAASFLFCSNLKAQGDIGKVMQSSPEDATKIVGAYMMPIFKGIGLGLNSGWHNTAKTKATLRFDLRITMSVASVPTKDRSYNTQDLGLKSIEPADGSANGIGPTIIGNENDGTLMRVKGTSGKDGTFALPGGIKNIPFVPFPQFQLTVGLPKNIDVSLRFAPSKNFDDMNKIGMFGVGVKAEVLPIISLITGKAAKALPFDLAVAAAYSQINHTMNLKVGNNPDPNQKLETRLNGFNVEGIISKKLLFFNPFLSVGYNTSHTNLQVLGKYEFDAPSVTDRNGKRTFTDPVSINRTDLNGLRASLGFQLNLAFFRVYASYTLAEYNYANAGIGFGIGK